jgi:hypothetical protein
MDKEDKIKLIWWYAIDAAHIFKSLKELPFEQLCDKIHEFQYELWEICGKPMDPRPKI